MPWPAYDGRAMTRRIAVLTTFEGELPFTARHPDDGAKVAAGLQPWRPDWRFDTYAVSQDCWPAEGTSHDAVVVTGSPASVHDDRAWITRLKTLLRERHAQRLATVGLCFGHQVIAAALGGRVVDSARGLRVGTVTFPIERTQPWMQPAQPSLTLFAAHDEQVDVLPPGAELLGGDAQCPVGAYAIGQHILGLQYHPEFSPAFMADVIDAYGPALCAQDLARARTQIEQPVDAALAMRWIAQFIDSACGATAP